MNSVEFASIYCTLATFKGSEDHHFGCFLGNLFKMLFRDLFVSDFGSFGDPFGTLFFAAATRERGGDITSRFIRSRTASVPSESECLELLELAQHQAIRMPVRS